SSCWWTSRKRFAAEEIEDGRSRHLLCAIMARRRRGKRGKRRRSSLARMSMPPINPAHSRWVLSSIGQARQAEAEFRRMKADHKEGQSRLKEDARKLVNLFVGNVPHGTLAPALVSHLQETLQSTKGFVDPGSPPILRCDMKRQKNRGGTYAFVIVRSEDVAKAFLGQVCYMEGRKLRINRSSASYVRPMGISSGFTCCGFQLCVEWPRKGLTSLWEVTSAVTFQVSRTSSLASLMFTGKDDSQGRVDFKRRHVDGQVVLAKEGSRTWMVFKLLRPPFISMHPSMQAGGGGSNGDDDLEVFGTSMPALSLFIERLSRANLSTVFEDGLVWLHGDGNGRNEDRMERVGDLSPNGAFGQCLVYRVDITELSQNERSRLFRELHAFRLCRTDLGPRLLDDPVPVKKHASNQSTNGWDATPNGRELYRSLPYSVVFLIACLTSNLKVESLGFGEEALSLLHRARERTACLALRAMFDTDPRARLLDTSPAEEIARWLEYFQSGGGLALEPPEETQTATVMIGRVSVTPLREVCQPPEKEMSNGVTRHFAQYADRFIRVNFVDENLGRLPMPLLPEKLIRTKTCVRDSCGNDRHLLSTILRRLTLNMWGLSPMPSPSPARVYQLRQHSCWFYAGPGADELGRPDREGYFPAAANIREWIGDLSHINVVGKYAARLGQSLSSTTSTATVPHHRKALIDDKDSGPYMFTDGCGLMSNELARRVADALGLPKNEPPPSAFQVRIGGCKGMLAVWPDKVMARVSGKPGCMMAVRPSLQKFPSNRNDLEVIQYARELPFFLNRQFITLLSTLDVPDEPIEEDLFPRMVDDFDKMVRDRAVAEAALVRYYNSASRKKAGKAEFGPLAEALAMVKAGFDVQSNPFLQSVLRATRDKAMVDLRTRTRILVPEAACLIGVVDETGLLQPGEVFFSLAANPGQLPTGVTAPPTGTLVLVCRNPSLHPGDLRVLRTTDIPQLRHLHNVVVFSCVGDRPEPSKMSGGDLDGDLYSVVWDQRLLPPSRPWKEGGGRNFEAMGYAPPAPPLRSSAEEVTVKEITSFFVKYVVNDNLGMIANAHLAWADKLEDGAKSPECIKLAELHSTAVDFCKSGVPAEFPRDLRVKSYPDFMLKKNKDTYPSPKLIGRLFRKTPEAGRAAHTPRHWTDDFLENFVVDTSLLVPGWQEHVPEAEVERFRAKALNKAKLEDVQARLNHDMAQASTFAHCAIKARGPGRRSQRRGKTKLQAYYRGVFEESLLEDKNSYDTQGQDEEDEDEREEDEEAIEEEDEEAIEEGEEAIDDNSGDQPLAPAPEGVEALQKASAWYFVSHSEETNPNIRVAQRDWRERGKELRWGERPPLLFLSFPWVSAHEHLCVIK
ncbi:unnamed protein product, partial [Ascophyllum nodosum]